MNIAKKENTKRIEWIDIAKGICIFLVVFGHTGLTGNFAHWLSSFRLPLFFFVSGILFKSSKYPTLNSFFIKRISTLVIPYIVFSIIIFVWLKFLNNDLVKVHVNELYFGWQGIALWFIPVLFVTEIFFYKINKYFKFRAYKILALITISVLGYICYLNNFHLPFKLEVVFTSVFYYGIGNISGAYIIRFFDRTKFIYLLSGLFVFFILGFYLSINIIGKLDLAFNLIGDYCPSYTVAFLGIFFLLLFSFILSIVNGNVMIKFRNLISFLGKNSYVILAFHQVVSLNLKMILDKTCLNYFLKSGLRYLIMWIILFGLIVLINNYLPWIIGRKYMKSYF